MFSIRLAHDQRIHHSLHTDNEDEKWTTRQKPGQEGQSIENGSNEPSQRLDFARSTVEIHIEAVRAQKDGKMDQEWLEKGKKSRTAEVEGGGDSSWYPPFIKIGLAALKIVLSPSLLLYDILT